MGTTASKPLERLLSLDAFRGLTIAAMILVNYPGSWAEVYPPLLHAPWDGLTPTDLIFPFFLFMVGVSVAFSYSKRLAAGVPKSRLVAKVIWRAVKIYALGMALYVTVQAVSKNTLMLDPTQFRYVGVLHRIAFVFLACGLLFLFTGWKTQLVLCFALLVGYWACMTSIPIPGSGGQVSLEPGRNLAAWVDSYLVPGRTYRGPWNAGGDGVWEKEMIPWDPEGAFSTLPAIASGLIGIFAGLLLLSPLSRERKMIHLYVAGFLLFVCGYFWGYSFPINKALWTSSYVLATSGLACAGLATCLFFVDDRGWKRIAYPAIVFGCNAITAYALATLLYLLFYRSIGGMPALNVLAMREMALCGLAPKTASLLYALFFVCVNFIPVWILYRFRIFIRL